MQTLVERGCGLDVHQATVVACVLIVRNDGKVQKQLRTFDTTTRELLKLRELSLKEASALTGMSIGALKIATHRAIASLRRALRGIDEG